MDTPVIRGEEDWALGSGHPSHSGVERTGPTGLWALRGLLQAEEETGTDGRRANSAMGFRAQERSSQVEEGGWFASLCTCHILSGQLKTKF